MISDKTYTVNFLTGIPRQFQGGNSSRQRQGNRGGNEDQNDRSFRQKHQSRKGKKNTKSNF